jgi:ribonuclease J
MNGLREDKFVVIHLPVKTGRVLAMGQLKPRYASTVLKDLLRLQLVDYLPGIYGSDLLKLIGKDPHSTPSITGLLLSHIHLDHSALISLLDERIPIVCSEITKAYAKALLDVGTRGLETEIYNFKRRPLFNVRDEPIERSFLTYQSGKEVEIDKIKITPYGVDHFFSRPMILLSSCEIMVSKFL